MKLRCAAAFMMACAVMWGCTDNGDTNEKPFAFAGIDTVVETGSMVVLLGSGSYDSDGAVESYEWLFPDSSSFVPVSNGDTSLQVPQEPTDSLLYVLRVTDNAGAMALDTAVVTVAELKDGNFLPIVSVDAPRVVPPGSTFTLTLSARDPDGTAASHEWLFERMNEFISSSGEDTLVRAPRRVDLNFTCVARVTDDAGGVGTDTVRVIVSWLLSPNGGEVFYVGDSMHIHFAPIEDQIGVRLIIDTESDSYLLSIPGMNESFVPYSRPRISFVIPEAINDPIYGSVSTVSETCRIQAYFYSDHSSTAESAGHFSIRPPQ